MYRSCFVKIFIGCICRKYKMRRDIRSLWAIGTGPGGVGRERSERRGRGRMTKRGASLQALRKGLSITASADSRKGPEGGKVGIVLVL